MWEEINYENGRDGVERYVIFDGVTVYAHVRERALRRNYGASFTLPEGSSRVELENVGMAMLAILQGPQREEFRRALLQDIAAIRTLPIGKHTYVNAAP